ncbi:MAG: PilZ domain-containing protein, partial [Magnetococcales bacterium]|nr:PilZ domain-containing protein [Magnetococcales bacterium]
KLGFPQEALQSPQKRTAPRIQVLPEFNIKVEVMRPSGISFDARFNDISIGGAFLCALKDEALLTDGSSATLIITFPKVPQVHMPFLILGSLKKGDCPCYRVRFKGNSTANQAMKTLIDALVQEHKKKRDWLFRKG